MFPHFKYAIKNYFFLREEGNWELKKMKYGNFGI